MSVCNEFVAFGLSDFCINCNYPKEAHPPAVPRMVTVNLGPTLPDIPPLLEAREALFEELRSRLNHYDGARQLTEKIERLIDAKLLQQAFEKVTR